MLTLAAVFIGFVLIVDLCVDIHERFLPGKKSIWTSKWAYALLIVLNILAIVVMSFVVVQEVK